MVARPATLEEQAALIRQIGQMLFDAGPPPCVVPYILADLGLLDDPEVE